MVKELVKLLYLSYLPGPITIKIVCEIDFYVIVLAYTHIKINMFSDVRYNPTADTCTGYSCKADGQVSWWNYLNCKTDTSSTTTFTTTTSTTAPAEIITHPFTPPPGCYYNDMYYERGTTIYEGQHPDSSWCYGLYCDENGEILYGDYVDCVITTTTATTTTTTTTPDTQTTSR